jgi:DHA2 family multidrug resistance protein-like MFS transporter
MPHHRASTPSGKATRREWIGLAVIALPCLLYSMDLTVLHLAVPSLSVELAPTSAQLLWIVDIYGFLLAGSLITMGGLGDRIGRRRLLLIGATAFGAASVLAAFSPTAEILIASRALLGVAGATLAPSTLSLIRNMFLDPKERTFAIGIWAASYSAGAAIGPPLGGVLLEYFWWGSVFLVGVPVMLLLLVLGPRLLPEFRDQSARRLDLTSAALSLGAVLAVIYGLKDIAQGGAAMSSVAAIALGLLLGLAFARRQRRLADPLIDLRLFRAPAFTVALAANTLSLLTAFGISLFVAQYLQLVLGLSPLEAGLWTIPSSGGFIAGSMLAPLAVRRSRPAVAMTAGLLLAALGFALLTQLGRLGGLPLLVAGHFILALGIAPVVTLGTDIIVGAAPPERAGAASAISETGAELGGALGIAILGSIGTAVYRGAMTRAIPGEISPEAMEVARNTLGGAVAVAEGLTDEVGSVLVATARDAFTQSLQVGAIVGVIISVALAILVAVTLRRPRPAIEARREAA